MPTSRPGTKFHIFDSLPNRVQLAIIAYADAANLSPETVTEFAITHFLELESISPNNRHHAEDGSELPTFLQSRIKDYAVENEMPSEFVVELAIAHFLDPDSVTFDDCRVDVQHERLELLR